MCATGSSVGSVSRTSPEDGRQRHRKEKIDKASRFMHDASKRRFHGKVVFTYRDGTPEHVEVTETHKL